MDLEKSTILCKSISPQAKSNRSKENILLYDIPKFKLESSCTIQVLCSLPSSLCKLIKKREKVVHRQLGIAEGLIGMATEHIERVNTHNFLGVGTPLGSDRRRQQNGTSIETSGTEDMVSSILFYQDLLTAWPPALADHLQNLYSLLGHEGLSDKVLTLAEELLKKLASIMFKCLKVCLMVIEYAVTDTVANPLEGAALGMSLLECFAKAGAYRDMLEGVFVHGVKIDAFEQEYGVIEMVGLMIVIDAYHGCFHVIVSVRIGAAVGSICYLHAGNVALMSLVTST
nr:hypothetical protein [Tanacetum cinerariifolium]